MLGFELHLTIPPPSAQSPLSPFPLWSNTCLSNLPSQLSPPCHRRLPASALSQTYTCHGTQTRHSRPREHKGRSFNGLRNNNRATTTTTTTTTRPPPPLPPAPPRTQHRQHQHHHTATTTSNNNDEYALHISNNYIFCGNFANQMITRDRTRRTIIDEVNADLL